jgi:uncharacterized membrane protein YhaH (DUF805 family)
MGFKLDHKTEGVPPATPIEAVKNGYLKVFTYSGCISRSEFWYFTAFMYLLFLLTFLFTEDNVDNVWETGNPLISLILGITVFSWMSAVTRRFRDIGMSGYYIFLGPFGIWWWCKPGINPKTNKYSNEYIEQNESTQ